MGTPLPDKQYAPNGQDKRAVLKSVDPAPSIPSAGPEHMLVGRLIGNLSSSDRKTYPMAVGLLDYFPDALAAVANISHRANEKHNPGQPTHWARGKSMDHADCIMRHLMERGGLDPEGNLHSAQLAWRALALLQEELEQKHGLPLPRSATPPGVELPPR